MQSGKSGCCELDCADCKAFVHFSAGRIAGVQYQSQTGEAAFYACFTTTVKRYRFREEIVHIPPETAIRVGSMALLIEALARRDRLLCSSDEQSGVDAGT